MSVVFIRARTHDRIGTTWVANERHGAPTNNVELRTPGASACKVLRDGGFKRIAIDTCHDSIAEVTEIGHTRNDIFTMCTVWHLCARV